MSLNSNLKNRVKQKSSYGALRCVLEEVRVEHGCNLAELTVLSAQVDPYRLDTAAGHRDGAWLAQQLNHAIGRTRRIHWRGLHYAIVASGNARKPDGEIFRNTDDDWIWLSAVAGKAARWLGYIPFERITDNRNAEPIIHRKARVVPSSGVYVGVDVAIPAAEDLEPTPFATGFEPRQAFQFVLFGEKASLEEVALPIAREHQADLYLNTGEISDTRIYDIGKQAVADGRPLVLFTLTDCDPAGYQMSVSIGRKLQACRDLQFHDLKFEIVPVALTVEQVRGLGLPSTPLKETEKRADRWREAFGVEQTEIDALATLQPNTLRDIIRQAFDPYFDRSLARRVDLAKADWNRQAAAAVDEQIDAESLAALREEAVERLAEMEATIADLNERLRLSTADRFVLPPILVPEAELDDEAPRQALVGFDDDWLTMTRALIQRKSYGNGHQAGD